MRGMLRADGLGNRGSDRRGIVMRWTGKDGDMDRVALITGGSRGIGAATALLAARQGWKVAVNYAANQAAADEVVQAIRAGGGKAIAVRADVADEAQIL